MATTKSVGYAVDAPPLAAAPFGLLNSLTLQPDDVRWEGGVGFESLSCAAKIDLWGMCDDEATNVLDGTGKNRGVYGPPFGVTATDTCSSTMSGSAFRDTAEKRVLQLLEASTQKAAEYELKWGWEASQATPNGRWLTSPDTIIVDSSGVAVDVGEALLLDAYAGCSYGDTGMLHMTPGAASQMKDLDPVDDVLYNNIGVPVISGTGYATLPADPGAWDGNWMFITGPTLVWLGEPQVYPDSLGQAVDIATNDIRFKAERLAAVTFDGCCVFAVKIDLTKA